MQNQSKSVHLFAVTLALVVLGAGAVAADKQELSVLTGPTSAKLGKVAQVEIPAGFVFIEGKSLRALMKASGQPVSDNLLGSIEPTNGEWSVWFTYLDVGYVKDDDKDSLNADKLLKQITDGTEAANKIRAESGNPPIHVIGWEQPPKYNPTTHNLEWAVKGECEGREILNYDTRLLSRHGVMQVKLIVEPKEFKSTLPEFTKVLTGYKSQTGESYAEYRPGDKVAKFGLAALVVGGAAVGAAKLGLFAWLGLAFKKFFKLIIVAFVAVAAAVKKFFARVLGRRSDQ